MEANIYPQSLWNACTSNTVLFSISDTKCALFDIEDLEINWKRICKGCNAFNVVPVGNCSWKRSLSAVSINEDYIFKTYVMHVIVWNFGGNIYLVCLHLIFEHWPLMRRKHFYVLDVMCVTMYWQTKRYKIKFCLWTLSINLGFYVFKFVTHVIHVIL